MTKELFIKKKTSAIFNNSTMAGCRELVQEMGSVVRQLADKMYTVVAGGDYMVGHTGRSNFWAAVYYQLRRRDRLDRTKAR
jgi:hypothetical protein